MDKTQNTDDHDFQWQDYFQDFKIEQNPYVQSLFEYRDIDTFNEINNEKSLQQQQHKKSKKSENNFYSDYSIDKMIDQVLQTSQKTESSKEQNLESNQQSKNSKDEKNDKQRAYSKTYRQKLKSKHAYLQEENAYLKKRIKELQNQLRQQEIELSRYKFPPPEKELSGEYVKQQYFETVQKAINEMISNPNEAKWMKINLIEPGTQFYKVSVDFYAERGFAGKKKLQILNYHFNEILQNIMKDCEKCLSLVFGNSKNIDQLQPLPEFEPITNIFMEIFKEDNDNLWKRMKIFSNFLHPNLLEFNKLISRFCKIYEQILTFSKKIHDFVIDTYLKNMQVGRRQLEMEKWFDFYKYGKLVRRMKYQWYDWMKSLAKADEQEAKKAKSGTKKKKITQTVQITK